MKRYSAPWLCALCALIALWTQHAAAQLIDAGTITGTGGSTSTGTGTPNTGSNVGGTFGVELLQAGGREYPKAARTSLNVPINDAACKEGNIRVLVSRLPLSDSFPYLEAWFASGSGNCNKADRNTRNPSTTNCTKLPLNAQDGQISGRIRYELNVPLGPTCDSDGAKTIFFLALRSQDSAEEATNYAYMTVTIDRVAPSDITKVSGGTGETQIPVTWTPPPEKSQYFWVLVDTRATLGGGESDDGGSTAECSSQELVPGRLFDPLAPDALANLPDTIQVKSFEQTTTKAEFNGETFGGSTLGAATVIAADLAGNPTKMSPLACLRVVKTEGFWESYKANGGTAESGCACTVPGTGAHSSRLGWLTGLPALCLLGYCVARIRTRRRAR